MTDTYKYFKYDSVLDFGHVSKAKQFFIIALTFLPPPKDKSGGGGGGAETNCNKCQNLSSWPPFSLIFVEDIFHPIVCFFIPEMDAPRVN